MCWKADDKGLQGPYFNSDVPYAANKAITRVLTKVRWQCWPH